ncbi:MAG: MFS transporter [Streptosporangiales bacterium]|nr:MFS transporter [Streptosporangiales bacterium]
MPDPSSSRWYVPRVVGTSALVLALTAPGQTAAVSAFVDPLIDGLELSRSVVSAAYLVGTLVGAGVMPLLGRAIDRYGARLIMVVVAVGFGAVLMGLSLVQGLVGLTAGFVGIRMLGQGALNLAATTAVALYVHRRRGFAQGITAAVGAAGISLTPVLLEGLVAEHGFRTIWFAEGLVIWATVIPLALLGLPRRIPPRDAQREETGARRNDRLPPVDWTLSEALRTPMFWVVASGVTMVSTLGTAAAFHQIALLGERGLSRTEAAANFLPQTVAGLAATVLLGYLADRVSDRLLIIASRTVLAGALVAAGYVTPGVTAVGYGMLMGVAGNSFRLIEATAFPSSFGLAHIGAIRGVVHTLGVAGSAVGPLLLSLGHDWLGGYRPALLVLALLPVGTIAFAAFVKPPPPRPPQRTA